MYHTPMGRALKIASSSILTWFPVTIAVVCFALWWCIMFRHMDKCSQSSLYLTLPRTMIMSIALFNCCHTIENAPPFLLVLTNRYNMVIPPSPDAASRVNCWIILIKSCPTSYFTNSSGTDCCYLSPIEVPLCSMERASNIISSISHDFYCKQLVQFSELPITFNSPPFVFCLIHLLFQCTNVHVTNLTHPFHDLYDNQLCPTFPNLSPLHKLACVLQLYRPSSSPTVVKAVGLLLSKLDHLCESRW